MAALKPMGTTRDRDLWDRLVNERFGSTTPILSGQESIAAAKKLYRHAMGKSFPGDVILTSGNRSTGTTIKRVRKSGGGFASRRVLVVNPDDRGRGSTRGLREMIHAISHHCHRRLNPKDAPHSARQARLEGRLVKFALERGFVDGALRREPPPAKPKPSLIQQRHARMVTRRDKWAAALKRAERLLAAANKSVKVYERRHAAKLAEPWTVPTPKAPADPAAPRIARPGIKTGTAELAAAHGIEIERHTDLDSRPWYVSHPDLMDTDADPHDGDHYAYTWPDVLERVNEIIAALEKRED